jgi:hypothetical protein
MAAAVPLSLLVIDPSGLSPFGPAKWAVLSAAVLASAGLFLRGRVEVSRRAGILWLAFLVIVALTAAFGVDPLYAWIGTPERHFGALTWLLCALAFLVGGNLDARSERAVLTACAVVAVVLGVWSAAELLGWEPVALAGTAGRPVGPLGSSAYLGAAAVLLAPIAALRAPALGAIALIALAASGARAALAGAIVALIVLAVVRRPPGRAVAIGAFGVVAVAALMGSRTTGVVTDQNGGARGRMDEWRVAVRAVRAHPLGVGPEGYRIVFGDHVDARYERVHGHDVLPDRAHSALLDITITTGILGLLAYGALLASVGVFVVRAIRGGDLIAVGLVAYAAQSLFLFPLAELDPVAWLFAGVVVRRTARADERATVDIPIAVPVVAGTLAVGALAVGGLDVVADRESRRVLSALVDGRLPTGTRPADLRPDQLRYHLVAARAAEARGTPSGYADALRHLDDAHDLSPRDPVVKEERARIIRERDGT